MSKRKRGIKLSALLLALCMVLTLGLYGCGKKESSGSTESTAGNGSAAVAAQTTAEEKREVLDVRIIRYAANLDDVEGINNDRIKKALEEKFDINIEYCSGREDYDNKLLTSMASGEVYDLVSAFSIFNDDTWQKWIKEGLLVDLDEYVAKDPVKFAALKKVLDDPIHKMYTEMKNLSADNNVCTFAMSNGKNEGFLDAYMWNKKYLDAVGVNVPTTWDEFENVLRAIKNGDPEGNGKKGDLLPFSYRTYKGTQNVCDFMSLFLSYGLPAAEGIEVVNGSAVDCYTDSIAKEVWIRLGKWVKEGLIDNEAVVTDPVGAHVDRFVAGQIAGVAYATPNTRSAVYAGWINKIINANPGSKPEDYPMNPPLQGPKGYPQWSWVTQSPSMISFIPADSKAADRMVELLNFMYTTEGQNLLWYGVEGIHHTVGKNGELILNEEEFKKDATNIYFKNIPTRLQYPMLTIFATNQCYVDFDKYNTWYEASCNPIPLIDTRSPKTPTVEYAQAYLDEWVPKVFKAKEPFTSAIAVSQEFTGTKKALDDIFDKYTSKWMTGSADVENTWDAYVKEMEAAGLQKYKQHYLEQYNAAKVRYEKYVK